jgi:hypothetical protein
MIDKSNYGKVGDALYVKMTEKTFSDKASRGFHLIKDMTVFTPEQINSGFFGAIATGIPICIDNNTQGDYEVVCEYGIEIHEWDDK